MRRRCTATSCGCYQPPDTLKLKLGVFSWLGNGASSGLGLGLGTRMAMAMAMALGHASAGAGLGWRAGCQPWPHQGFPHVQPWPRGTRREHSHPHQGSSWQGKSWHKAGTAAASDSFQEGWPTQLSRTWSLAPGANF